MQQVRLPSGGTLTLIERKDWDNSRLGRKGYQVKNAQFRHLVLHHTVTLWHDESPELGQEIEHMRKLQTIRPDLGLDVPYSFVLFEQQSPLDVVIGEGRGFGRTGAHTAGHNSSAYGCALAGNYDARPMSVGQIEGLRWIGSHIEGDPRPTMGHRDYKSTACPGGKAYAQLALIQPPFTKESVVMDEATSKRLEEIEAIIYLLLDPEAIVDNAYLKVLGRKADKAGRAHWLAYLLAGGSVADMLYLFEMGPEAKGRA